jgi:hypothetical protein
VEAFQDFFELMAGTPAIIGLFLTAVVIFLTSDWRLSLGALLVQYILVGLALTRFIEPEVAVVKILAGVLVIPILFLGARHGRHAGEPEGSDEGRLHFLGLTVGWDAGPLGLPLRFLAVLLVFLTLIRLLGQFRLPITPAGFSVELSFIGLWMGSMGIIGLILGGGPLRAAAAILTILSGFDLVYATLEPSLAIVGFYSALTLLTALAFSYLAAVQAVGIGDDRPNQEGRAP